MANNDNYTITYQCYRKYENNFLNTSNVVAALEERRNFVQGKQYEEVYDDIPRPVFNICREDYLKTSAKILETKASVNFISDTSDNSLEDLDEFYEYNSKKMKDAKYHNLIVKAGIRDGIGICLTAFDADTIGIKMSYKGYLKRQVIPFEQTFWENPLINDVQDQRYIGYFCDMDIGSVFECLEGSKKEIEKKKKDILLENDINDIDIDTKQIRTYVRFFRIKGEVVYEMTTKTVEIYKTPHFLNPIKNDVELKVEENDELKQINDYKEQDPTKYVMFSKPKKTTTEEHYKEKEKFGLYPISIFVPYPLENSIIGESKISFDIQNQKIINYADLMGCLIMQNHAMPKILTKPDALRDQEYDNSPNQILTDYTPITSGVQWGITRLQGDGAINNSLIEFSTAFMEKTRQINGFADLNSELSANMSGYLYEQAVRQQNLTLQQPQKRYWEFIADTAAIDLMYFKHYIDEVEFYKVKDDAEISLQENYGKMAQDLEMAQGITESRVQPINRVQVKTLKKEFFDRHFDVLISVEQGIASSEISESQHINEIWQYVAAGNLTADKIKMLIQIDPGISRKVKQKFNIALEELEVSDIQRLTDENAELKKYIQQLMTSLKQTSQRINEMNMVNKAQKKAFDQTIKENQAVLETAMAQPKMSESEVKSNNAKGKGGTSFTK